jgi:exodeoxyribonuclease-3
MGLPPARESTRFGCVKIVTWNVNSVSARKERLLAWLQKNEPDVLCLQELKTLDDGFPRSEVEALGYQCALFGQKTYNGVGILSKQPLEDVKRSFGDGDEDAEARMISAKIAGLTVLSCYIPNGQTLDSPKQQYKLRWLDRLLAYLNAHHKPSEPLLVCGDYNIAPEDRDVNDVASWQDSVLFHESVKEKFRALLAWGLVDTFRLHVQDAGKFSWWDYRQLSFPKGVGLRIDHILATRALAERCTGASIDRNERKGKLPSDHAPVVAELSWP